MTGTPRWAAKFQWVRENIRHWPRLLKPNENQPKPLHSSRVGTVMRFADRFKSKVGLPPGSETVSPTFGGDGNPVPRMSPPPLATLRAHTRRLL